MCNKHFVGSDLGPSCLQRFSADNKTCYHHEGVKMPILFSVYSHSALQIFQREAHPSAYKAGTSNSGKEGLSLFGKDIFGPAQEMIRDYH